MAGQAEAFLAAVKSGEPEQVERFLQEDPSLAMVRDDQGLSPLIVSLYYRQKLITALLLDQGVVLDFFEAAAVGDLGRAKALYAQDGTLIDAFTPDGFTALHYAAFFGQPAMAEWLLARRANPNAVARNPMQVQPLHSAASARQLEIAELLLKANADVNATQEGGFTPMDSALQNKDVPMVELLKRYGGRGKPGTELTRVSA